MEATAQSTWPALCRSMYFLTTPDGLVNQAVENLLVTFDKEINPDTFEAGDIVLLDPSGTEIPITQPPESMGGNVWRISFPAQSVEGEYHLRIGPHIASLAGHEMDQDLDGAEGEEPDDVYVGTFTIDLTAPEVVACCAGRRRASSNQSH